MPITAAQNAFKKMISFAESKRASKNGKLIVQSISAGYWIAIFGHALLIISSLYYVENDLRAIGTSRLLFGIFFPGAFVAIVYTGSELFTGNTVTMILLLLDQGSSRLRSVLRVWLISLIGNSIGTIAFSFLLSCLSGDFSDGSPAQKFLFTLMDAKIHKKFHSTLIQAVACNSLVCLATWCCASMTGAGRIFAIFYSIGTFVIGGYEHLIANMYYGFTAFFIGYGNLGKILLYNLLPSMIGNVIAGIFFTGFVWWYEHHPIKPLANYTDSDLLKELSHRIDGFPPNNPLIRQNVSELPVKKFSNMLLNT